MLGFSMIQLGRRMRNKLDKDMRQQLVQSYCPFRSVPYSLHRP